MNHLDLSFLNMTLRQGGTLLSIFAKKEHYWAWVIIVFYWNEFLWLSYWSKIQYSQMKTKKKMTKLSMIRRRRMFWSLIFYNKLRIVSSRSTECNTLEVFWFGLLFLYQQPIHNERCCTVYFWFFFQERRTFFHSMQQ